MGEWINETHHAQDPVKIMQRSADSWPDSSMPCQLFPMRPRQYRDEKGDDNWCWAPWARGEEAKLKEAGDDGPLGTLTTQGGPREDPNVSGMTFEWAV